MANKQAEKYRDLNKSFDKLPKSPQFKQHKPKKESKIAV